MNEFPKTLLVTWCTPESRYAGGEAIRRLLARIPRDRVLWCGFHSAAGQPGLPEYRAFPLRRVHWRLEGTAVEYLYTLDWQSRGIARRMWEEAGRAFQPEIVWVVPELAAAVVGRHIARLAGLPLHLTLHDAPEFCRHSGVPLMYAGRYVRHVRRAVAAAQSIDCVSDELREHMETRYRMRRECRIGVVRPPAGAISQQPMPSRRDSTPLRKIALCGSFRMSALQWRMFLRFLGNLPYVFEIIAFTPKEGIPPARTPVNVKLNVQPYLPLESDMLTAIRNMGVDAFYLGVWTDSRRRLFARTSLSSKMSTYAAAGAPILVDAPENSVAWHLVSAYGAGIRIAADAEHRAEDMIRLMSEASLWERSALGAHRLGVDEFDPALNVARLAELMGVSCGR